MVDIGLILAIISVPIAFISLYISGLSQVRSSRLNAFDFFIGQLGGKDARMHRGIIRNSLPLRDLAGINSREDFKKWMDSNSQRLQDKIPELDETLEWVARDIAVTYDRVGFILAHYPAMEVEILEWNGATIDDMWKTLKPMIYYKWRIPPFDPRFASNFELLGEKADEYLQHPKKYIKHQHLLTRIEVWFGNIGIYNVKKEKQEAQAAS